MPIYRVSIKIILPKLNFNDREMIKERDFFLPKVKQIYF